MSKLIKLFLVFGPVKGCIKVIKKYANPGQTIDESLMSTLCLPQIEFLDQPGEPRFQTFLVTKEDGQILYGSGLIVHDRHQEVSTGTSRNKLFASYCYTVITDSPFIHATRSLLQLIWNKKCDDMIVRSIMNIPLPAKRKCLRIVSPFVTTNNLVEDIFLYRGMTPDLPLLDYPLRELFNFLHVDDFLLAYICILMEFRTLIISKDNYKLMMVGETLTSLLLPLKWCNVYVPILPPIYGATYLDAPTSYIMGINTQVTDLPDNLNHIQCRIYCDESRVECDADSLVMPLFLNDIKKEIIRITARYQSLHANNKPFSYLDDLKFNREIRILFIKTIRKNILANYERYIVDVPEASSDIRQFDVVSYLSDQPEFMRSFLSKFLETQLFVSFVDESAKRMQQSWTSIFDMDPDDLSNYLGENALEQAFLNAQRVHLMDLRQERLDIEVKTVPASPMKLRRRMPALSAIASRLNFSRSANRSTSIDLKMGNQTPSPVITSSPPMHRNSVAIINLQGHLSSPSNNNHHPNFINNSSSNGKIVELINQVRDLSKKILIESNNTTILIGSLCDLIERVWAHGAFHQDSCPLWNHLLAFTRIKLVDTKLVRSEFSDGSNLNVLSPKSEQTELDMILEESPNLFGSTFNWLNNKLNNNKYNRISPLAKELIDDLKLIHTLKDVKTDVGKARAFIKLSLEKKKLSDHLKTLTDDQALLDSLYKPYAFLRCEEEREQFLTYLFTLQAVDLPCFTTTFVSVINTRKTNLAPSGAIDRTGVYN